MRSLDVVEQHEDADNERALAALLAYIAQERDRRRKEILDAARSEADAVVGRARLEARQHVREAVGVERLQRRTRLQAARAASASRLRRRQHEVMRARLDEAWDRLEAEVIARWERPDARHAWLAAAFATAARHLPAGTWTLAHPTAFEPEEARAAFADARAARPDVDIACLADDSLQAGVRIGVANAVLDVTAAALLGQRAHVEGLLLGLLARADEEAP